MNSRTWVVATTASCGFMLYLAWHANRLAGGTLGPLMNLFYLPVLLAAVRFKVRGAAIASALAAIVSGPLLPAVVATNTPQPLVSSLLRLPFFLTTGLVVAIFADHSLPELTSNLHAWRTRKVFRRALEDGEFFLDFQPVFELATGRLAGAEALIRWDDPRRGIVPPSEFIPAAESNGMIVPIGRWVAQEAIGQAARIAARLDSDNSFSVAFNISASQLGDDELLGVILESLTVTGLPPAAIHVEITETAVIDNFDVAVKRIDAFRTAGIQVAIDDFGTGQSSLGYLRRFRVDILKVDRTFVGDCEHPTGQALVTGIVRLAQDLGAITVAEGIETELQADAMRAVGCHLAQGYYYARPGPPDNLIRIIELARIPTRMRIPPPPPPEATSRHRQLLRWNS